jgi:Lon protease-like protein
MTLDLHHLQSLPVFPLPNTVLLPGGMLPLHVFEPRYREMTRDCLAGSRTMAIALLLPGFEATYHERPPIHDVCGVGTILCSDELPDGRYQILLRGVARVRIERELPSGQPYRLARAALMDGSQTARPDALATGHRQLLALCSRLGFALEHGGAELNELVNAQPDPGACADVIAAALMTDPDRRQSLLESLDAADRVDAAIDLIARVLCDLTPAGAVN